MRTKSGAAGVVIHDGNILLMYREKLGKKYFVFPGGGIETGETPEQAVVREFDEETSIEVGPIKEIYYIKYDDGTDRHYFLCQYISGIPKLREDAIERQKMLDGNGYYEPRWVSLDEFARTLVYPLQIRDWVCEDLKSDFAGPFRKLFIKLDTERQV